MPRYLYGMRHLRGFGPGCQPGKGLIGREDDPAGRYNDVLVYDRELEPHELDTFNLDYIGTDPVVGEMISRQAALNLFPDDNLYWDVNAGYIAPHYAKTLLKSLPSTQPDVIRCKDCAYCDSDVVDVPYGMTKKIFWCDRLYAGANENLVVDPDDFCSWAERREDAID